MGRRALFRPRVRLGPGLPPSQSHRLSVATRVAARGYDEQVVRRIVALEQQFRFKRRLMLIARLSGSAVNLDQEIPRD